MRRPRLVIVWQPKTVNQRLYPCWLEQARHLFGVCDKLGIIAVAETRGALPHGRTNRGVDPCFISNDIEMSYAVKGIHGDDSARNVVHTVMRCDKMRQITPPPDMFFANVEPAIRAARQYPTPCRCRHAGRPFAPTRMPL